MGSKRNFFNEGVEVVANPYQNTVQRIFRIEFLFLSCFVSYMLLYQNTKNTSNQIPISFHALPLMRCFTIHSIAMTLW